MPPDPLADLRDIRLPSDPAWWPPAPGWWLLAILAIAALIAALIVLHRRAVRNRPRRRALALLRDLSENPREGPQRLSQLLRRAALQAYPRDQVAGLTGPTWLAFLDRTGNTDQFASGPGRILVTGPYRPERAGDLAPLVKLAERWVRTNL